VYTRDNEAEEGAEYTEMKEGSDYTKNAQKTMNVFIVFFLIDMFIELFLTVYCVFSYEFSEYTIYGSLE
jgi:hypothetical protein